MSETKIPKQKCSKCGYDPDCTSEAYNYGDRTPKSGDISMCLCCGHLTLFNADLSRREPTKEEALKISLLPEAMEAQMARIHIVGDQIKNQK